MCAQSVFSSSHATHVPSYSRWHHDSRRQQVKTPGQTLQRSDSGAARTLAHCAIGQDNGERRDLDYPHKMTYWSNQADQMLACGEHLHMYSSHESSPWNEPADSDRVPDIRSVFVHVPQELSVACQKRHHSCACGPQSRFVCSEYDDEPV